MSWTGIDPQQALSALSPDADWVGLRFVRENTSYRTIRNDVPENINSFQDAGVMVEVFVDGHFGYAGTGNLTPEGLRRAFSSAKAVSQSARGKTAARLSLDERPKAVGRYSSQRQKNLDATSLGEIMAVLQGASRAMKISDQLVNRVASTMIIENETLFLSSNGSEVHQDVTMAGVDLNATAVNGNDMQTRSWNGGLARAYQIGSEIFDREMFGQEAARIAEEAMALLKAENCPTGICDLILMPDQMMLQIHESIGHPLELDRILGDERNYAGWSFVKPEDFGRLQYGSPLMSVTFDPTVGGQFASYAFDDAGHKATKEYLIREGRLLRGLGALESQKRLGLPGVANFRASSWNRAPIDRMANINVEPGNSTLEQLIGSVQRGVLMQANRSWSIDDYRNKFQFGCEYGQWIEDGKIRHLVKNPNYRGTTVDFWNRLRGVGGAETVGMFGTPYCGKGEPNQVIRVGHASPPCLFEKVEVFGGGQ